MLKIYKLLLILFFKQLSISIELCLQEPSSVKRGDSADVAQSQLQVPESSQIGSGAHDKGFDSSFQIIITLFDCSSRNQWRS